MFCFYVTDLHGATEKYKKLFGRILENRPEVVFIGGDILPGGAGIYKAIDFTHEDFVNDFLISELNVVKNRLGKNYPDIFIILGNDDGRSADAAIIDAAVQGNWNYIHNRRIKKNDYSIYGYNYVNPTPYQLKDWERYDVYRYKEPGAVSPEDGSYSFPIRENEIKFSTIKKDLEFLVRDDNLKNAIFLFHAPPYNTKLDRAVLDRKMIDHVPLDLHVGSIAIRRLIEKKHPRLTLHGHVHESARISGSWKDKIGSTICLSAAYDGPELALIKFKTENLEKATRELL